MAGLSSAQRAIWQQEGAQKRGSVRRMFAEIAPSYDALNSIMSLRSHHRWRRNAVAKLELLPGQSALDVCCGTGDFMVPLKSAVGEAGFVAGLDFCTPMLERAQEKLIEPALAQGDACALPIGDETFDAVSVGWGIRNVPDIDAAHRECFRVLKPGGRFVSLDMALPRTKLRRTAARLVSHRIIPWLGRMIGKVEAYTYLPKSTESFRTREELKSSMEAAGFVQVGYRDFMGGNICMHWGRRP